jgi:hypothetical protein
MARGGGFRRLFWIFFLASAVYLGIKLVPPWFSYRMLSYEVEEEAKIARSYTNDEILAHILESSSYWNISLTEDNIEIERDEGKIEITVYYDVNVNFLNRFNKLFHYDIYAAKPLRVE